jgi:16S rRNA (guanine966-N2)-methyltransferase
MKKKSLELLRTFVQRGRAMSPKVAQTHEIRIIGGQWKRTKLKVADKPNLRPTPDRVRETLFNWLGQDLTGWRCMDAFAGTGVLGFEAASRGAQEVTLVEQDNALVELLQRTQEQLKAHVVRIVRGEGVSVLRHAVAASQNLIFLDPPFDSSLHEAALEAAARVLTVGGFVFLEAAIRWTDPQLAPAGLVVHRHLKAGVVHSHLLRAA